MTNYVVQNIQRPSCYQ